MAKISLTTIIDDILLLVRNSNISESEDLSRALILAWIMAHKHTIWKEERDKKKIMAITGQLSWEDLIDNEFVERVESGPLELENVDGEHAQDFTKKTKDKLENVLDNSPYGILAIYDLNGEVIQYMDRVRRHYNYWRKYTFGEMTAYYKDDGHIYVLGLVDEGSLKYIYVTWLKENEDADQDGDDLDENEIQIPAWTVPIIKDRIIKGELAFMLNRPSDDSNNATLASVKPHGPQDDEE